MARQHADHVILSVAEENVPIVVGGQKVGALDLIVICAVGRVQTVLLGCDGPLDPFEAPPNNTQADAVG